MKLIYILEIICVALFLNFCSSSKINIPKSSDCYIYGKFKLVKSEVDWGTYLFIKIINLDNNTNYFIKFNDDDGLVFISVKPGKYEILKLVMKDIFGNTISKCDVYLDFIHSKNYTFNTKSGNFYYIGNFYAQQKSIDLNAPKWNSDYSCIENCFAFIPPIYGSGPEKWVHRCKILQEEYNFVKTKDQFLSKYPEFRNFHFNKLFLDENVKYTY